MTQDLLQYYLHTDTSRILQPPEMRRRPTIEGALGCAGGRRVGGAAGCGRAVRGGNEERRREAATLPGATCGRAENGREMQWRGLDL